RAALGACPTAGRRDGAPPRLPRRCPFPPPRRAYVDPPALRAGIGDLVGALDLAEDVHPERVAVRPEQARLRADALRVELVHRGAVLLERRPVLDGVGLLAHLFLEYLARERGVRLLLMANDRGRRELAELTPDRVGALQLQLAREPGRVDRSRVVATRVDARAAVAVDLPVERVERGGVRLARKQRRLLGGGERQLR